MTKFDCWLETSGIGYVDLEEADLRAAWNAALEEAARVCEALEMPGDSPMDDLSHESATYDCRDAILALKEE